MRTIGLIIAALLALTGVGHADGAEIPLPREAPLPKKLAKKWACGLVPCIPACTSLTARSLARFSRVSLLAQTHVIATA